MQILFLPNAVNQFHLSVPRIDSCRFKKIFFDIYIYIYIYIWKSLGLYTHYQMTGVFQSIPLS